MRSKCPKALFSSASLPDQEVFLPPIVFKYLGQTLGMQHWRGGSHNCAINGLIVIGVFYTVLAEACSSVRAVT